MKNIRKLLLFIFCIVFLGSFNYIYGYFEIDNYDINATILENGDMEVEENITYKTTETRNGVYRNIECANEDNKLNSASAIKLKSVKVNGELYKEVSNAYNGNSGVYLYNLENNNANIKVYTPFKNVGKTVTYTYILKDVGVKYADTSELFWNFVGYEWEDKINNLNINITLPQISANEKVYVFAHGSDNGTFSQNGNIVNIHAENIAPGNAIDARILFSKDALTYEAKYKSKNVLNKYINEEQGMSKKIREYKGLIVVSVIVSVFLAIYCIYITVRYYKKYIYNKYMYYREIPEDITPDMVEKIIKGKVSSKSIWVTFMHLVTRGRYIVFKELNERGKEEYKIKVGDKKVELNNYEEEFVTWFDRRLRIDGKQVDSISIKELNKNIKKDKRAYIFFANYRRKIENAIEKIFSADEMISKSYFKISLLIHILFIIFIAVFGIISNSEDLGAIAVILGIISAFVLSLFAQPNKIFKFLSVIMYIGMHSTIIEWLNEFDISYVYIPYIISLVSIVYSKIFYIGIYKQDVKNKLKGLKRYIKHFSYLNEKDMLDEKLWKEYLVYAMALGVSRKIQNRFIQNFENQEEFENINFNSFEFKYAFNNIRTTDPNSYSSSSSGGGYSSSGGFSSGGGSGGRRRWWPVEEALFKICFGYLKKELNY